MKEIVQASIHEFTKSCINIYESIFMKVIDLFFKKKEKSSLH